LYFTNEHLTESYYDRHLTLVEVLERDVNVEAGALREAEDRRLARRLQAARSKPSNPRMAGFRRAIALWGRTSTPFFRA
jgi:hypothetical protein